MALHHLELSREQLAPRYGLSRYTPGIIQDVIPPGISPPAEGERSPVYSPVPPSISVVLFEEDSTATAVIGRISIEKGPGIVKDTATPPSPVCEYKTFAACGWNPW